jgi:hypothetical protein
VDETAALPVWEGGKKGPSPLESAGGPEPVEVRMSDIQVDGREEAPGYTPVRADARVLARYWVKKRLDHECRDPSFAEGRLAALAEAAGEDLVNEATEQVNEELRRGESDHIWDRDSSADSVVLGYTPTREEVRVLARFWAVKCLRLKAFYFAYRQFSSRDFTEVFFAECRLGALAKAAGEDLVNEATEEVKAEEREWWSGHFWDCFERDYLGAGALVDTWPDDEDDPPSAEAG